MFCTILPLVLQSIPFKHIYKLIIIILLLISKHRYGKYFLWIVEGSLAAVSRPFFSWSVRWGLDYGDENLSLDIDVKCFLIRVGSVLLSNCTFFFKCAAITSPPWNATVDSSRGTEFRNARNSKVRCFSQRKQRFIWVRERNTWCNCELSQKVSCLLWIGVYRRLLCENAEEIFTYFFLSPHSFRTLCNSIYHLKFWRVDWCEISHYK